MLDEPLESLALDDDDHGRRPRGGGGRGGRDPAAASSDQPLHMSQTFWERIERGNNLTKIGAHAHPRDAARLIAAQARACVDPPTLQVVGPQSTNQGLKAIAIARAFLKESDDTDVCMQPEFTQLEDGHTGILLHIRKKMRRISGEAEAQQLKAAASTDAKVLAGAISSFAREGRRMVVIAIGAGSINQAVKAIAIARKNVEEEAIDILCKPEFTEVHEGGDDSRSMTAIRMLLLVEQT